MDTSYVSYPTSFTVVIERRSPTVILIAFSLKVTTEDLIIFHHDNSVLEYVGRSLVSDV